MTDNYGEFSNYGTSVEYSKSETSTFHFENQQQLDLYNKAKDANLQSFYYSAITGFILMVLLGIIIISYGLCYFMFGNTYNIFLYLFIFWVILVLFHIYKSNNLNQIALNLRQKVINEIPNKTVYK